MNILSRYIFRLYLINIATLLVILSTFVVTVDVLINLGRFSRQAARLSEEAGTDPSALNHALLTVLVIVDIWGPRLLQLFVYLNGLVLVAAAGFTATQLVHHREVVAILASGQSMARIARPFLVLGALMVGVQAGMQEFWIPRVAHLLQRDHADSGRSSIEAFSVKLAPDREGRLWYAASFDAEAGVMEGVTVWERRASGSLARTISAPRAAWDTDGWALEGGLAREHSEGGPRDVAAPSTPVDRIPTSLDPQQLKVRFLEGFARNLSLRELGSMLEAGTLDERASDRVARFRWARYSTWFINVVTLVATMSVFLQRMPRPMLAVCLRAAPIGLLGFACSAMASNVSLPGLPAWISAFLPALLVLGVALAVLSSMRS